MYYSKWGYRDTFLSIYFLLRKIFATQKTPNKWKPTNEIKEANKKTTKATIFCVQKLHKRGKIVYFVFLCCRNFFKNKQKSVFITSLTILLTCTSLNLPMENLFACTYFYLWESLFIHDNLGESFLLRKSFFIYDHWWESFWTLPVCGNLFLFMLICKNLFLFMFICENLFY